MFDDTITAVVISTVTATYFRSQLGYGIVPVFSPPAGKSYIDHDPRRPPPMGGWRAAWIPSEVGLGLPRLLLPTRALVDENSVLKVVRVVLCLTSPWWLFISRGRPRQTSPERQTMAE